MINFGTVEQDQLGAILGLEREAFPATQQWSEQSWSNELSAAGRDIIGASVVDSADLVGLIVMQTVAEIADLQRIIVAPAHRRSGLGAELVRLGVAAAKARGAELVLLEVRYDNEPAIALYQSLGFEQLTVRDDYYGQGQHALVCKLYDLDHPALAKEHPHA